MKYIVHKRFKGKAICGDVNLPAMTELECEGERVLYNGKLICYTDSQCEIDHFCRNDDGKGMERGHMTQAIKRRLAKNDDQHQARWDKVLDDPVCQPLRRQDDDERWFWGREFYNADIDVLKHIANLVGAKEEA